MKLQHQGNTLCVSDVPEINLANAAHVTAELRAALWESEENVVIDLSGTKFVDCGGLGALVALRNDARKRPVHLDLVNPPEPVMRLLRLTHLDRLVAAGGDGESGNCKGRRAVRRGQRIFKRHAPGCGTVSRR